MDCCKENKTNNHVNEIRLGGWSIEHEVYDHILKILPHGSTILELGSGNGTAALAKYYNMISIEHNLRFIGKFKSTYIHAPMKNYWYNVDIVKRNLPTHYDFILIDGPIGNQSKSRIGFYENISLFNTNVPMLFDDTNRDGERRLFKLVCEMFPNKKTEIFKTFSIIYA